MLYLPWENCPKSGKYIEVWPHGLYYNWKIIHLSKWETFPPTTQSWNKWKLS